MRGLANALCCEPPTSRWSPGGVFLADLTDRYVTLAERLRRNGEPAAMTAAQHADWFTALTVDRLPTDSVCRVFADLQMWEMETDRFDPMLRGALTTRIRHATLGFIASIERHC